MTDHFMVVAKFKMKLRSQKRLGNRENIMLCILELLKDKNIQQEYAEGMRKYVEDFEDDDTV